MEAKVLANLGTIEGLCRRFHVRRLEVFGPALRTDFHSEGSDVDFVVEFAPESFKDYADDYFGLKHGLETVLEEPVELIAGGAVRNPGYRESIEAGRQLLYAA